MTRNEIISGFKKYVPDEFADFCADLLIQYQVDISIKRPRNSKSGDYRPPYGKRKKHQVTVNSDLNPYYFLLVYVHEIAHVKTFEDHGRKAMAHGEEWKNNFREMAKPILNSGLLPKDLQKSLERFFIKTPATFMADEDLTRVLRQYDKPTDSKTLEELPDGSEFTLENGLRLIKVSKLRTWYLCKEPKTGKKYRVKGNATVREIS